MILEMDRSSIGNDGIGTGLLVTLASDYSHHLPVAIMTTL